MKRSELKVGEAYYYARSSDWMKYSYYGSKAVVVDDKRYTINKARWGHRDLQYTEDPKGNAALVDIHYDDDTTEKRAVPVAHIRGPWEQTLATVQAAETANREKNNELAAQRANNARLRAAMIDRANALGITVTGSSDDQITIPMDDFLWLLDAYELAGRNR